MSAVSIQEQSHSWDWLRLRGVALLNVFEMGCFFSTHCLRQYISWVDDALLTSVGQWCMVCGQSSGHKGFSSQALWLLWRSHLTLCWQEKNIDVTILRMCNCAAYCAELYSGHSRLHTCKMPKFFPWVATGQIIQRDSEMGAKRRWWSPREPFGRHIQHTLYTHSIMFVFVRCHCASPAETWPRLALESLDASSHGGPLNSSIVSLKYGCLSSGNLVSLNITLQSEVTYISSKANGRECHRILGRVQLTMLSGVHYTQKGQVSSFADHTDFLVFP